MHDFRQKLDWSQEQAVAPYWEVLYRKWFPDFLNRSILPDGHGQRRGRDSVIVLTNGESLRVQEKARDRADTGDILLEFVHEYPSGYERPGWVESNELYQYLAYVFVPTRTGYLFPFQSLRAAWLQHREDWLRWADVPNSGFWVVPAQNKDYVTKSLAVPTKKLYQAVGNALRVRWTADEEELPF